MLLLDTTIVNVAQQKIKEGLNADLPQIQWVLDSYILAFAVLLLSFGRMGDVFGRKKLFVLGMAIFTAASALCGASGWLGRSGRRLRRHRADRRARAARDRRRLHDAADALADHRRLPAAQAGGGDGDLGSGRRPRRGARPDRRRLDRHQLRLGVGLPDQRSRSGSSPSWPRWRSCPSRSIRWPASSSTGAGSSLSGLGIFALVYALDRGTEARAGPARSSSGCSRLSAVILLALFVWWERRVARSDGEAGALPASATSGSATSSPPPSPSACSASSSR